MTKKIAIAAQIANVREVSLTGSADLAFWKSRLESDSLTPIPKDDRAQILIISADMRFFGIRFQEVSFSILARPLDPQDGGDGAFLLQAFNSRRFFAWVERTRFHTPYNHARIDVHLAPGESGIEAIVGNSLLFRAKLNRTELKSSAATAESWTGPIYLPTVSKSSGTSPRAFCADVSGQTTQIPFDPMRDEFAFSPNTEFSALADLAKSDFALSSWLIRPNSNHAKSKTYSRTELARRMRNWSADDADVRR